MRPKGALECGSGAAAFEIFNAPKAAASLPHSKGFASLQHFRHTKMPGARIRRIGQALFRRQRFPDFILSEHVLFKIFGQRDVACRLDVFNIHLFQLLHVIENALKLSDKGIELLIVEMKLCEIGDFQYFCARY
jgi:hypothetical protein